MKSGTITVHPNTPESFSVELVEGQVVTIGRKPTNAADRKLILPFPEVSAQHAEIRCHNTGWTIIDSGSTNGTTLNGTRLSPGREYPLKDKDVVGIAQFTLWILAPVMTYTEITDDEEQDRTLFRFNLINATILVGDLKNFSSLMEKYADNPEPVMQAASRLFEALNEQIGKNQGQLEKIAGDAIMAYWQADKSNSDAEKQVFQACSTALELKELTAKLARDKKYWPFADHPLILDMALATGPVAAGSLGRSQFNPALLGDTANIVFRLEKLIGEDVPNVIVVDGNTYELVKDRFEFSFLGTFSVKGRQKSVNVYELVGLKT